MRILWALVFTFLVSTPAFATFSIVAFDPLTGDLGVVFEDQEFVAKLPQ